jgi:uncharacterized protein (DUF433 family)
LSHIFPSDTFLVVADNNGVKAGMMVTATISRIFECEDLMLRNKPTRKAGQDIRTLPTYTIPEAATFLAINQRTLFSWYEGDEPILKASGNYGSVHLLSYRDIEEAYRVYLLREKFKYTLQFLKRSMRNLRKMSRSQHPLEAIKHIECLRDLVYDKPARGKNPHTTTSLGRNPGQQFVKEVVDLFAERIEAGKFIFPWRLAATDHQSRPVSMNPHIMSGRLVVVGTRIPVIVLWERKRDGENIDGIAKDYGLDRDTVEKAITHIGKRQKAA